MANVKRSDNHPGTGTVVHHSGWMRRNALVLGVILTVFASGMYFITAGPDSPLTTAMVALGEAHLAARNLAGADESVDYLLIAQSDAAMTMLEQRFEDHPKVDGMQRGTFPRTLVLTLNDPDVATLKRLRTEVGVSLLFPTSRLFFCH